MFTQEDADHLTCEEAANLPRSMKFPIEFEDDETFFTVVGKVMLYRAVRGEFDLFINEKGEFFFKSK